MTPQTRSENSKLGTPNLVTGHTLLVTILHWIGLIAAWAWTVVAGFGGVGLIITLGPWPPTNGWFALFSGLSACPLTAWLLKKFAGINFPGWSRLVAAVLIIMAGRLALKIEGRGTFLPGVSSP